MCQTIIASILIWLLALVGLDDHYLLQTSCDLPCWNEISPSKTNEFEAKSILSDLQLYRDAFIQKEFHHQDGSISYVWWYKYDQEGNSIKLKNEKVVFITLQSRLPTTLENFVSIFGEPAGTRVSQSFDWQSKNVTIYLEVFYPRLGLVGVFVDQIYSSEAVTSYVISPTMVADKYYLYPSADTLQEFAYHLSIVRGGSLDSGLSVQTITLWEGINSSVPVYR